MTALSTDLDARGVAAANDRVIAADGALTHDLLTEADAFNATFADTRTRVAMHRFLDAGGQIADGERRLGELAGGLAEGP